jgi:multicomponent Na+:H+ antiporter subunit D
MCLGQHHVKRLLAFVTISQIGVALIGVGLFSAEGVAAAALLILADGLLRAGLFVCIGAVIHRVGSVNELRLQGLGRQLPRPLGVIFLAGALGLAAPPFLGAFAGKLVLEHAATDAGQGWVVAVFAVATILSGAAVLRAGGRIFLGRGAPSPDDPSALNEPDLDTAEAEIEGAAGYTPPVMIVTAGVLVAAGLVVGLVPGLVDGALDAAARFTDRAAYAAAVLRGATESLPDAPSVELGALAVVLSVVSVTAAVALAASVLSARRTGLAIPRAVREPAVRAYWMLRRLHSGQSGDYVAWLSVGAAAFGVLMAVATR